MLAEETVVIAASAPDAVAVSIKGHAGDDDEVEVARVRLVLRLQDVEVAHGKTGALAVFHGDDVVADDGGQDDLLFQVPFFEEGLGLHLVGQGTIQHHPLRLDEVGMAFQFGHDLFGLFQKLFLRMLFLQGLDVGA